eukprot:scaffold388_cov380-Prasinococcus_capsulatus_cf.AAC.28
MAMRLKDEAYVRHAEAVEVSGAAKAMQDAMTSAQSQSRQALDETSSTRAQLERLVQQVLHLEKSQMSLMNVVEELRLQVTNWERKGAPPARHSSERQAALLNSGEAATSAATGPHGTEYPRHNRACGSVHDER